ncbi:MAG: hypothetical protein AAF290_02655 [Pseudomonadota bacterium]
MQTISLYSRRWVLLFAAALLMVGCELFPQSRSVEPRIREITISSTQQGVPPVVEAQIVIPGISNKRVRHVTAEFRSTRVPDRAFIVHTEAFESLGNNRWRGALPALNVGRYEVKVVASLRDGPRLGGEVNPPIDTFISAEQSFSVSPDIKECFNFAAARDTQNWVSEGFKSGADGAKVQGCPDSAIWFDNAMFVLMGIDCQPPSEFRVELVSPNLTDRPGWEDPEGLVTTTYWNIPGMTFQPIFSLRDSDVRAAAPLDDNGEFRYAPQAGSAANPLRYRSVIKFKRGTVDAVRLRYLGSALTSVAEGLIKVNSVCPIVDRPASD